jgi:coproporphyrinogen III oxidase-like Fe-S oxidoreductase
VREALVSGLRLVEGVDLASLGRSYEVDVSELYSGEIDDLIAEGLLVRADGRLRIPAGKLLVSNAVLSRFV